MGEEAKCLGDRPSGSRRVGGRQPWLRAVNPPAAGSRCGAKNQRGMTLLTPLLLSPPPSAHQVRGSTGSRDWGCHRGGVTAAGAVLSGSLLLAAQAGGPTEETQVRGVCPPPSNPTVAHLGRGYSGAGGGHTDSNPFPCSAMEKGKLHKAAKDSKRGRQVSGTRGPAELRCCQAAVRGGVGRGRPQQTGG